MVISLTFSIVFVCLSSNTWIVLVMLSTRSIILVTLSLLELTFESRSSNLFSWLETFVIISFIILDSFDMNSLVVSIFFSKTLKFCCIVSMFSKLFASWGWNFWNELLRSIRFPESLSIFSLSTDIMELIPFMASVCLLIALLRVSQFSFDFTLLLLNSSIIILLLL